MGKKNRKEKSAGREKHRQLQRLKKRQRKERKKVELPVKHRKQGKK